jgi:hypothetical protein
MSMERSNAVSADWSGRTTSPVGEGGATDEFGRGGPPMLGALRAALERVISTIRAFGATLPVQAREPKTEALGFGDYQRVAESKYHPPSPAAPAGDLDLPEWPGPPGVTLMAVDPYLVHVYWDFDIANLPPETTAAALRFYDEAGHFDVDVDLRTRNWYVPLWSPAKTYYADLGAITAAGEFIPLIRSNTIQTSRAWPVTEVEHRFVSDAETVAGGQWPVAAEQETVGAASRPPTVAEPLATKAEPTAPVSPATGFSPDTGHQSPATIAAPPPSEPPAPRPPGAAETLRRRLWEIYECRQWPAQAHSPGADGPRTIPPLPAAWDPAAWDLADGPWQPQPQGTGTEKARAVPQPQTTPDAPDDLTARTEREFSAGLSSLLLGAQGPRKPAG